ncbi:MAG: MarR family transcriptional regulator [Candidatus Korarchaeum sp.]|nr:MarR family transcriptional regulator [Candidatus Korarchaeum sp.]MDW8036216.1 MarR family transcriptional regulator [Candidatus Korarchaeum sp.]
MGSLEAYADPTQEVGITRMGVIAELFENSSVRITVIAELKIPKNFTGTLRAVMFPVVPIGISLENPAKGVSSFKSLSQGVYVQKVSTQSFSDVIVVSFKDDLKPGETRNVSFSFTLTPTTALAKFDDSYRFAYRFYKPNVTLDYNRSLMEVILPRGAGVTKIGQEGTLGMDPLSERLTAVWYPFPSPRGGGWDFVLEFKIMSQLSGQPIRAETPSQQTLSASMIPLLLISNVLTAGMTLLVTTVVRRFRYGRDSSALPDSEKLDEETLLKIEEALEKLDRDEKSVLDVIYRNNGKIEQKDLPELTGFSKSKVSRVLKRLDSMKFVRRVSQGKTKIVELNPAVSRVMESSSS